MSRSIYMSISPEGVEALRQATPGRNRAGVTLRDWLVGAFDTVREEPAQGSLFGTTIEVDDDVPLLLEALGRVTRRPPDDLVDAWAKDTARGATAGDSSPAMPAATSGKVAELLDLGETLFEQTLSDARSHLGSYPEGEEAARAAEDVFRALRALLGISREGGGAPTAAPGS